MSRIAQIAVLACLPAACVAPARTVGGQGSQAGQAARSPDHPPSPDAASIRESSRAEVPEVAESGPGAEPVEPAYRQVERPPHPLVDTSAEELETMLLEEPASLGPISVGQPASGALFNGVQMPEGDHWEIVNPRETWGTQETVDAIAHAITRVAQKFPDTPPLKVGDISDEDGGHLTPHISHQSGRDVDLGYYYADSNEYEWYVHANEHNLDLPRTWALVKAFVTETDVQAIFIDTKIQNLLKDYALSIGENERWLDSLFGGPTSDDKPLISHEPGHATHLHVRFYNPIAQETGRRVYKMMVEHKLVKPPTYYVRYKCKRGDTLGRIANRYNTSVKALKRANGLRGTMIIAGRTYKIPRRGGVRMSSEPLDIPDRRLPPTGGTNAASATASPER